MHLNKINFVKNKSMKEHETKIAYWAGRLIGYDQAWEVAEEIVETIKKVQSQALHIHDVRCLYF
jgi:hypothetical protein